MHLSEKDQMQTFALPRKDWMTSVAKVYVWFIHRLMPLCEPER
jgi:hypothetical protein